MALAQMLGGSMSRQMTIGMQLSVICAEDAAGCSADPADADTVLGTDAGRRDAARSARSWPTGERAGGLPRAAATDVPVLLLSGEFDPVTPPRYGEQVLQGLAERPPPRAARPGPQRASASAACRSCSAQFLETADAKALDADVPGQRSRYAPPFTGFNGWEP